MRGAAPCSSRPSQTLTFPVCLAALADLIESCYVGDAAGRSKDHGDGDRKWAANAGLAFYTPEVRMLPPSA